MLSCKNGCISPNYFTIYFCCYLYIRYQLHLSFWVDFYFSGWTTVTACFQYILA